LAPTSKGTRMQTRTSVSSTIQQTIDSVLLARKVKIDFFTAPELVVNEATPLLLINDGQDMEKLGLTEMLLGMYRSNSLQPILCVAIHAGFDRKMEYGTASQPDYLGRGARAAHYRDFVITELLPHLQQHFRVKHFQEMAFAGFSLGGLSALDIVWHHPHLFSKAGVFSGSLWWRKKAYEDGYDNDRDRIMHQLIRKGAGASHLRFFFQCGLLDETADRNNNGIIDSVEDTRDMIQELKAKGYADDQLRYFEMKDGAHNIETWATAMPHFLKWGWGK